LRIEAGGTIRAGNGDSTLRLRKSLISRREWNINTVEMINFSLGIAFDTLEELLLDLIQEHADWQPPGTLYIPYYLHS